LEVAHGSWFSIGASIDNTRLTNLKPIVLVHQYYLTAYGILFNSLLGKFLIFNHFFKSHKATLTPPIHPQSRNLNLTHPGMAGKNDFLKTVFSLIHNPPFSFFLFVFFCVFFFLFFFFFCLFSSCLYCFFCLFFLVFSMPFVERETSYRKLQLRWGGSIRFFFVNVQ
jgi:hypothetical protein